MRLASSEKTVLASTLLSAGVAITVWFVWVSRQPQPKDQKIVRIAISRTGKWLAAGTAHGPMAVWNRAADARPFSIPWRDGPLNDLQFSPDERQLAVAGRNLSLWPLDSRQGPWTLRRDKRNYGTVRFSPDGRKVLTVTGMGTIEILDLETGRATIRVCCSTIYGEVAFSSDGARFISAGHWPGVWDATTGNPLARLTRQREDSTFGPIVLDHDRGQILMGSQDGGIRIWSLDGYGLIYASPRSPDWVDTISLQASTGWAAFARFDKELRLWNPRTGMQRRLPGALPTSNILFTPDQAHLVMGAAGGTVEFWDALLGQRRFVVQLPRTD